jgi:O-antigen/teichoic acid export membrane protein
MNILLNFMFIPRFGILGAAYATLIAQGVSNTYLWWKMKKISHFEILPHLTRIIGASALMGLAVWSLSVFHVNFILIIGICACLYFLLLHLLKEPLLREVGVILRTNTRDPEPAP